MKRFLFVAIGLLFVTTMAFAENQIVYDVGIEKVQVIVNDSELENNVVAVVNFETADVVQLDSKFTVTAEKIFHKTTGGYFVAIQTKIKDCLFLYCTDVVKPKPERLIVYEPTEKGNQVICQLTGTGSGGMPGNCRLI